MPSRCPPPEQIANFVSQTADADQRELVETHVDECQLCRQLLTELIREAHPAVAHDATQSMEGLLKLAGTRLGRFELQACLGGGAMGVVYAAVDTTLQREVAIKFVRPSPSSTPSSWAQTNSETLRSTARVLSEARALAGVQHRNVVAIYDVGIVDGTSFIVMEKVPGQAMPAWLATGPSFAERLAILHQLALGLAAAHHHGILHRDIKPSNMQIADGRAVVLDFGLAAMRDAASLGIVGTPGYMAPEAVRGEAVTARSDIFSFACMAYECFVGASPFANVGLAQRQEATRIPTLNAVTFPPAVPKRIASLIRAGLADDPLARPASMQAFADALRPKQTRWRWWLVSALLVGVVVGVSMLQRSATAANRVACRRAATATAATVWTATDEARLAREFAATGKPYAAAIVVTVQQQINHWQDNFQRLLMDRCERSPDATPPVLQRCFEQVHVATRTQLARLSPATAYSVEHAVGNVFALPVLERCLQHPEQLLAIIPPELPAAVRQRINQMRHAIGSGDTKETLRVADELIADATWQQPNTDNAFAYFALGDGLRLAGQRTRDAQRYLTKAVQLADEHRQDYLRAEAQLLLAHMQISDLQDATAAQQALDQAATAIVRAGNPPELTTRANVERATLLMQTGDDATAAKILTPLVAAQALSPASPSSAAHLDLYGNALQRHDPAAAALAFSRAVELWDQLLGPQHPDGAIALTGLAGAQFHQGKLDQAAQTMRQAVQRAQLSLAADHPMVLTMRSNLANILMEAGQNQEAVREHEALVAIARNRRNHGERDRELSFASAQLKLATALSNADRDREALPLVDDSVAIYTKLSVPLQLQVRAFYVQSAIHSQLNGSAAGVPALERVLTLLGDKPSLDHADPMFMLAQLIITTTPARARKLAQTARDQYLANGNPREAEKVTAWLAQQK